jgi:hypothetical protein
MSAFPARIRCDAGQAVVFVVVGLAALVGIAALVIDGGSWLRTHRQVQTAADAAALAGAQDIPNHPAAQATAIDYAQRNFSGIAAPIVTFPSAGEIDVVAEKPVSGMFMPAVNATARAHARAQVSVPLSLKNVAPVAVKNTAACAVTNPGCYGQTVTVSFDESNIGSALIGLIDLRCPSSSSAVSCPPGPGAQALADWIASGYPDALPANMWYGVKTGENTGPIRKGLQDAADIGKTLFFPVFDQASTADRSFHIIGWAAFVIDRTGVNWSPSTKQLTGHFTTFIATDVASGGTIGGATDFGVHVITLTQ